mmetsp:Transcript_24512/g.70404  ORF Transcript_24512/g.70404 Transcript_24512/m.70404 type:complete len:346 (+) Transcript_24512:51-1088(+)
MVSERVLKLAAYGGIGAGALVGWSVRFFLKHLFTKELAVTGEGAAHADLLANMLGAFVMGLLSRIESQLKPWHPSIYVCIGTGFCGSCTTFSSWMLEAGVQTWTPSGPNGEHLWARQLVRGALIVVVGLGCLLWSLSLGQWAGGVLALVWQRRSEGDEGNKPAPTPLYQHVKSIVYWSVLVAVWLSVIALASTSPGAEAGVRAASAETDAPLSVDFLAGLCFAPLGAWLRFELSKFNRRCPKFPAFTLAANLLGTALSAACWVLLRELEPDAAQPHFLHGGTWVLAVAGGFCGSLSSASTFAAELDKLSHAGGELSTGALVYGSASILGAQTLVAFAVNYYLATI